MARLHELPLTDRAPMPPSQVSRWRGAAGLCDVVVSCVVLCVVVVSLWPRDAFGQRASPTDRRPVRIAVFDSRVVFDSMPGRNAVESEFALEQAKARTMVAAASDSLRLALDDLVRADERLTPREREAGKLHLRARELLVEQMVENLDAVIQQRLKELRRPLVQRIHDAVRAVRIRMGYQLVLDRSVGDGLAIDADDAIDITAGVLLELRKAPLSTAPTDANRSATRIPAPGINQ